MCNECWIKIGAEGFDFLLGSVLPAICIVYLTFCLCGLFCIMFGSFVFIDYCFICFFSCLIFCLVCLLCDLFVDSLRGLFDVCCFIRCIQYCFVWFIISELLLFLSLFYVVFSLVLFVSVEFAFVFVMPIMFSCLICDFGFVFYWYFIDIFNLLINTFLLFVSGLFVNFVLFLFWFRFFLCVLFMLWVGILFGFLFLWNQVWEFALLFVTCSCGVFGSILFLIDLLHFSHVFLGIFLLFLCFSRCFNFLCMDTRFVFLYVVCLYWHFVDCVWFFLLRFVYFDVLSVVYLYA
uniref:Cytochrome c oxidase subunit 3 n=1 Tax=Leishmania turanica TaxID=62297 RepID=A0A5H3CMP6_9TRYP|nr:TPA_asm: cytochrome oxidase subunit III [Leishmania turanica]